MRDFPALALALALLILSGACSSVDIAEIPEPEVIEEGDQIFIVDQTGKQWNITHAVKTYAMRATSWQYGLGPNAIRPVLEPTFLSPGDLGYPSDDASDIIIGTTINGDSRAYKINDLNAHEVVDETFGETHVAVGW